MKTFIKYLCASLILLAIPLVTFADEDVYNGVSQSTGGQPAYTITLPSTLTETVRDCSGTIPDQDDFNTHMNAKYPYPPYDGSAIKTGDNWNLENMVWWQCGSTTTTTTTTTTTVPGSTTTTTLAGINSWSDFGWVNAYAADETGATDCSGGTCDDTEELQTWTDVGSAGQDLDDSTEADGPTFDANGCPDSSGDFSPGEPSIVFNGSSEHLENLSVACADGNNRCTVVIIGRWSNTPAANERVMAAAVGARAEIFTNGTQWRYYAGGSVQTDTTPTLDTNYHTIIWDLNGTTGGTTPWCLDATSCDNLDAGENAVSELYIGSDYTPANWSAFDFCAIGLYEGDATADADWSALQTYVCNKWNLDLGGDSCP